MFPLGPGRPGLIGQLYRAWKTRKHRKRVGGPARAPPLLKTSFNLSREGVITHLVVQALVIMVVGILWHRSVTNNGLATVSDVGQGSFYAGKFHGTPIVNAALLWTTVPAWFISAYAVWWSGVVQELWNVSLSLRLWDSWETVESVLIQEMSAIPFVDTFRAFLNGQMLLSLCSLMKTTLWFASGLAAAVLSPASAPFNTSVPLMNDTYFEQYLGVVSQTTGPVHASSISAFDIITAVLLENAPQYPWTSNTHSIAPFTPLNGKAGNYTADVYAYSSTLQCSYYTLDDLVGSGATNISAQGDNVTELTIRFNDKDGCLNSAEFLVDPAVQNYSRTWSWPNCEEAAGRARVGSISGQFSPTAPLRLANFSFVSCKPQFLKLFVSTTVRIDNATSEAEILSISERNRSSTWPGFWHDWIDNLPLYDTVDVNDGSSVDLFSSLVLSYNQKHNSAAPFNPSKVVATLELMYSALYAALITNAALLHTTHFMPLDGTLTTQSTRLFVFNVAAVALIGVFSLVFCTTIMMGVYLHRRREEIKNHRGGQLLAHAFVFHHSKIDEYLLEVENKARSAWEVQMGHSTGWVIDDAVRKTDLVEFAKQDIELSERSCSIPTRPKDASKYDRSHDIIVIGENVPSLGNSP